MPHANERPATTPPSLPELYAAAREKARADAEAAGQPIEAAQETRKFPNLRPPGVSVLAPRPLGALAAPVDAGQGKTTAGDQVREPRIGSLRGAPEDGDAA